MIQCISANNVRLSHIVASVSYSISIVFFLQRGRKATIAFLKHYAYTHDLPLRNKAMDVLAPIPSVRKVSSLYTNNLPSDDESCLPPPKHARE